MRRFDPVIRCAVWATSSIGISARPAMNQPSRLAVTIISGSRIEYMRVNCSIRPLAFLIGAADGDEVRLLVFRQSAKPCRIR